MPVTRLEHAVTIVPRDTTHPRLHPGGSVPEGCPIRASNFDYATPRYAFRTSSLAASCAAGPSITILPVSSTYARLAT